MPKNGAGINQAICTPRFMGALNHYLKHSWFGGARADADVNRLLTQAEKLEAPIGKFYITMDQGGNIVLNNKQATPYFRAQADRNNIQYSLAVPNNLQLQTGTGNIHNGGQTVTLKQNEMFRFLGALDLGQTYTLPITSNIKKTATLILYPIGRQLLKDCLVLSMLKNQLNLQISLLPSRP